MSLLYRVMYRIGFTPWDTGQVPPELSALIEGAGALPAGRALDIGCGTGTQAMYLAGIGGTSRRSMPSTGRWRGHGPEPMRPE